MTRDDIIRMAREAGHHVPYAFTLQEIERFAALVAAAEREACARVCEEHAAEIHGYDKHGYSDAIRARG